MARYKLTEPAYINLVLHQAGDIVEYAGEVPPFSTALGSKNKHMQPVNIDGTPLTEAKAAAAPAPITAKGTAKELPK